MSNLHDLLLLLLLGGAVGLWLTLARSRERAVQEARRLCERHGLQLLDETVGLRQIRWRKIGHRRWIERGYGFEVSVDGDDRESGRLWMVERQVTGLRLPTTQWQTEPGAAAPDSGEQGTPSNVIPLHSRLRSDRRHH